MVPTLSPWILLPALLLIPLFYWLLKTPSIPSIPTATPHIPLIGNSVSFGIDPVQFLLNQRAKHGDIFLVNLAILRVVFFLGPDGTNAILKGTEKGGISFWAALSFLIGGAVEKGIPPRPTMGLTVGIEEEGWVEASRRIMIKSLNDPENVEYWMNLVRPLAKQRFTEWAESGEPVSLFRGMSNLVMTLLLYIFMGPEFAEQHAEELVPMIQAYEWSLQKPQTKVLPRSMSPEGRLLDSVEERMKTLIDEEVLRRLESPSKYQKKMDYLQMVLNAGGGKFIAGILPGDCSFVDIVYSLHILALVNGGHTNQTSTFVWSLLHSIQSPLLESLRPQKSNDLLEATIRETGRLYTNLMMLRRVTTTQSILGKTVPKGTFVACSPIATARDPALFYEPDKFRPERWLTPSKELDEQVIKDVVKTGSSILFGKGQHACLGERFGRSAIALYWGLILGEGGEEGFDVEIVDGLKEGKGVDGVGVEPAWVEENLGTPFEKDGPLLVVFKKRTTAS